MNSYYTPSLFANYATENPHMAATGVGYTANNYGLFSSRFADQLGYHTNGFNAEHQARIPNGYSHQAQDLHSEHGRIPAYPLSTDETVSRPFNSCGENWNSQGNVQQSGSPDSGHNTSSPFSGHVDGQTSPYSMVHKDIKDQQNNSPPEQPAPYYPWMGIVGK